VTEKNDRKQKRKSECLKGQKENEYCLNGQKEQKENELGI